MAVAPGGERKLSARHGQRRFHERHVMTSKRGLGWIRDLPDMRDYTSETAEVGDLLKHSNLKKSKATPAKVDMRQWCSPIEDQESLGSCTANAGVGLLEYFERRAFGKHLDASRLFLYKATRNLDGDKGDVGATLRRTMQAMVMFGVPPESYWPYQIQRFDVEPAAFHYSLAQNFQSVKYYRLDPPGSTGAATLENVKAHLAAGLPSMFGFRVYSSIDSAGESGNIPYPAPTEHADGGHAIVAIGYDDARAIGKEKGALFIRNSWGEEWGDNGYGWLPYKYVLTGLAVDFWSLIRAEYVDSNLFK